MTQPLVAATVSERVDVGLEPAYLVNGMVRVDGLCWLYSPQNADGVMAFTNAASRPSLHSSPT
jgi:hypothetical protein